MDALIIIIHKSIVSSNPPLVTINPENPNAPDFLLDSPFKLP